MRSFTTHRSNFWAVIGYGLAAFAPACVLACTGVATASPSPAPAMSMPMPMPMPMPTASGAPPMATAMSMRSMPAVTDLGVPMSREGSGTSWLPDSTTTYGHATMLGTTMLMTHGVGFVRYSDAAGERGSRTLNAPNWYMAMLSRPLGPTSQIGVRAMTSVDFLTVGGFGYPEPFQTGETYAGRALHDHQHPHDLVSELSLDYSRRLTPGSSISVYAGYPGEPALGPPTYMHRAIAYDMADAPIGHHWEDSSHVTFGVVTAGLTSGRLKLEGSAFTGREPNEVRTNFDRPHLDSYSGRLSFNPNANVSTQVSYGFIRSPEALTPGIDRRRITVSILTNRPLGFGQYFTTSTVFGQNADSGGSPRSNAFLFEADLHRAFGSVYTRAEFVEKSGSELALDEDPGVLALHPAATKALYPIGAFSLGFVRDTRLANSGTILGLGAQVTLNTRPGGLRPFYGTQAPYTFELFARFRPGALR